MHTLYKLVFGSGKIYIGQTVRNMNTRMQQHRRSANSGSLLPVHCAWRKYGEPEISVIAECLSQDELHSAEKEAIISFDTLAPNGYNVSHGGDTAPSKNPDVAKKISEKATGRKHADTSAWSAASKRSWKNEDYREKVSSGLKASWSDERRKAASDRINKMWSDRKADGWTMPEIQKEKLRGKAVSEETRAKMSAASKGKAKPKRSAETCQKLSAAVKSSWENADVSAARAKAISDSNKRRHANMTEEEKRLFSELRKKAWETRKLNKTV